MKFLSTSTVLGTEALEAFSVALWYFLRYFKTPAECLCRAVTGGGDTRTIGCITGSLLGALHGSSWFPLEWVTALGTQRIMLNL